MKLRLKPNQMEEIEGMQNEYPYAFHHVDLMQTAIPWHWHEALEFNYITNGKMKVSTPGQTFTFSKGQGFFINSNVLTAMTNLDHCIMESHLFHPVLLGGHFNSVFESKYLHPVTQNREIELVPFYGQSQLQRQLLVLLQNLTKLQQKQDVEFQTRGFLGDIWLLLMEELSQAQDIPNAASTREKDRLLTMVAFIQEHYREKLLLDQIAASAAISSRECLRCFRNTIGQTPTDYLISCRVEAAKKLLCSTNMSITQVAMDCGFHSSAYFSKVFRAHTAKTPQEYRRLNNSNEKSIFF